MPSLDENKDTLHDDIFGLSGQETLTVKRIKNYLFLPFVWSFLNDDRQIIFFFFNFFSCVYDRQYGKKSKKLSQN